MNQVTLKLNMVKAENTLRETTAVPKSAEADQMTDQEEEIYRYVLEKEAITAVDVCQLFDVKERRARDVLSNMCKKNLLRKQGATSNIKYVLNKW